MARQRDPSPRSLLVEIALYAVLVAGYLWGVLLLLDDWVADLSVGSHLPYAVTALALIVGQGFVLDIVAETLLRFARSWLDEG